MWIFPEPLAPTLPPARGPKVVEGEAEKSSDSSAREESPSCWKTLSLALKYEMSGANVAVSLWSNIKEMNP